MNHKKLIGLYSSVPRSGKTTFADALVTRHGYRRLSFATPLKAMLNVLLSELGVKGSIDDMKTDVIGDTGKTGRELAQLLGTDFGRNMVHPDLWVMPVARAIEQHAELGLPVVLDDARFFNEAEMIKRLGGIMVKIERPGWTPPDAQQGIKGHASEGGLDNWPFDYTLAIPEGLDAIEKAAFALVGVKRVAYVAGPMRGYPLFNFPAFDEAEVRLRNMGYDVVNPAQMDRESGFHEDSDTLPDDPVDRQTLLREFMRRDLNAILDRCTHVAMLPGWEKSAGAKLEKSLAEFLGLDVLDATTGRPLEIGA